MIFHSYVSLPEGKSSNVNQNFNPRSDWWLIFDQWWFMWHTILNSSYDIFNPSFEVLRRNTDMVYESTKNNLSSGDSASEGSIWLGTTLDLPHPTSLWNYAVHRNATSTNLTPAEPKYILNVLHAERTTLDTQWQTEPHVFIFFVRVPHLENPKSSPKVWACSAHSSISSNFPSSTACMIDWPGSHDSCRMIRGCWRRNCFNMF